MQALIPYALHGIDAVDAALLVERATVGAFFMLSGCNKLLNSGRHAELVTTFKRDRIPLIRFNEWFVPSCEAIGGTMLIAGLLSSFAAFVLTVIIVVAICCEARDRVASYKPINHADTIADYLYLPEVLYAALLAVPLLAGAGRYSLDALIF